VTGAVELFESLHAEFFRYYDTPFALSDRELQAERRVLLDRDNGRRIFVWRHDASETPLVREV
jgi:hypothetical protein